MVSIRLRVLGNEEVTDYDTYQDNEDFHQSNIKIANHIKLRECMFGSLLDIPDSLTCRAK